MLLLVHILDALFYALMNDGDLPILQYQACINPYTEFKLALYKLMPLTLVLIYMYNGIIIHSNTFLYLYLKTQTENNIALKEADRKRDRKRNFVPAKTGFIAAIQVLGKLVDCLTRLKFDMSYVVSTVVYATIYPMRSMDNGTKAYILSIYNDIYPCVINPLAVLFGAPTVRRKINKFSVNFLRSIFKHKQD